MGTTKINLPTYYKNKLFTEKERELLFIDKIDKGIIYVLGTRVHRDNEKYYIKLLEEGRKRIAWMRLVDAYCTTDSRICAMIIRRLTVMMMGCGV